MTKEDEFDHACWSISEDADFIATAPAGLIKRNYEWIEEARDRLTDALQKASRKAA